MRLRQKVYEATNTERKSIARMEFSFEEMVKKIFCEEIHFYAWMTIHNSVMRETVYFTIENSLWADLYYKGRTP